MVLVTEVLKHATSSVFLFATAPGTGGWRLGLIHHPRFHRWMLPGGHVEPHENPAQTALREVAEETGLTARLINLPAIVDPGDVREATVAVPLWIVEHPVPAESRLPQPHVHVDHLYLALALETQPPRVAELRFDWFGLDALADLDMFAGSQARAQLLFDRIADLAARVAQPAAS